MSARDFYNALGLALPDHGGPWIEVQCFNPAHDHDRNPSCGVNVDHGGFRCHACDAKGSAYDAAVLLGRAPRDAVELCKRHGLGRWDDHGKPGGGGGGRRPPDARAHVHTLPDLTVQAYADSKRLPAEFLRDLGISDYRDARWPHRVLRVPYRDTSGRDAAVRIRRELHKRLDGSDDRFLWRKGSKPVLYGLWRLDQAREQGFVVLVEGESDVHTLWHHGVPCVGLPGAGTWKDGWIEHFHGIERVFVVVEPDEGGEAVLGWLGQSKLRDRAWLVELDGYGDPSGLHLDDPERFGERWREATEAAEPWRVRAARTEDAERREVGERCAELAAKPRILDCFAEDLRTSGIVGEERLAKLVYLAATSRLLDSIVSVAVKGPSAAGKSYATGRALSFFPASAYYVLTAMSERGLIFVGADMRHRMLVVYEAQGMAGDLQSYLLRSLLSEGRIRYQTTRKEGGEIVGHVVELEGPTGLIVTTTAVSLHAENETRLLSVTATDTPDQTKAVMQALAEERDERPDLGRWHALQRWLELADHRVTVPFGMELAEAIPPVAVRLRRDFGAVLGLIRAHALLHQASRERDAKGRVVASVDDYAAVRGLVADLVAEGVERTVSKAVREAVEAVRQLAREHGATRREVAEALKIDPSAAGRRLASARSGGYLRNLEESRGKPARWVTGDPLPEGTRILPLPEDVCACARDPEGFGTPPPPGEVDDPFRRNLSQPSHPSADGERVVPDVPDVPDEIGGHRSVDSNGKPPPEKRLADLTDDELLDAAGPGATLEDGNGGVLGHRPGVER